MFAKGFRYLVRAAAGAVAAGLMFASLATTQTQAATVAEFLANPTQVMAQYPNGGPELTALIRDVATSNPQALATLTSLLSAGNVQQQASVGAGLGQAYLIVLNTNQAYAAQIAAAVGASGSDSAKTAYSGATGNVATASTGPGAGAGGGGGGAGGGSGGTAGGGSGSGAPSGGSNSGSTGTTGQSSTQTSGNTFTGGGGGSPGSSGSVSAR
ncbi:MAG: hypothetical protein Q8M24_11190 [Pseudolabrys sp.]|nr:hypothetical protein [Pseudolabrys sp.]